MKSELCEEEGGICLGNRKEHIFTILRIFCKSQRKRVCLGIKFACATRLHTVYAQIQAAILATVWLLRSLSEDSLLNEAVVSFSHTHIS